MRGREVVALLAGGLALTAVPVGARIVRASLHPQAAAAEVPDWSRPREMPSLVVQWQRPGEPCAVATRDGTVYVLEPGRLLAVDAENGSTRWEHALDTDNCPYHWQRPLLALDDVIVVGVEDHLEIVDRMSGAHRQTQPLGGRFSTMWGPPVLVEARDGEKRELLTIDPVAGRIVGRHSFGSGVYDVEIADDVALVTSKSPSVLAVTLPELKPLWSA